MAILCIPNRTENWKTARLFSPMFFDKDQRLAFTRCLSESHDTRADDVRLELFWRGIRDHLANTNQKKDDHFEELAGLYNCLFGDLRECIENFGKFRTLSDWNYTVSEGDVAKLGNNLVNTEIDIVLQTPGSLYIGEAKGEMSFNTDGKRVLVHQLVRQYVTAKILVRWLGSDKRVVPFVVGKDAGRLRKTRQIEFMIKQGWLCDEHVLTWKDIEEITERA